MYPCPLVPSQQKSPQKMAPCFDLNREKLWKTRPDGDERGGPEDCSQDGSGCTQAVSALGICRRTSGIAVQA
jgi:hypothetical protein